MTRYRLEPLARLMGVELGVVGEAAERNLAWLAGEAGVTPRTASRWLADGVSERVADRLASRLGFHPAVVWPEWMVESTERASRACANEKCSVAFVPDRSTQRYCSATCRKREAKRRERSTTEGRAKNNDRRRAYYAEYGAYERARERRRYAEQRKAS